MWAKARKKGIDLKCLTGMNVDMMVRTINPDFEEKMTEFGEAYKEVVMKGKNKGRVTNPAGTDFTFKFFTPSELEEMAKMRPTMKRGGMLGGQGALNANPATINGKIVVDGAFWPPSELGLIKQPIEITCKDGRINIVSDHHEARIAKNWFAHFRDEIVYNVLHVSTGFSPGVKRLSGDIVEDERLFGCVEFGVGRATPELPCHTDCILVNPSIWIDDLLIEKDGIFVEPKLKKLAKELGMQLWVN
jgi:leucyl aminopeptidase (aminopeptidase T)